MIYRFARSDVQKQRQRLAQVEERKRQERREGDIKGRGEKKRVKDKRAK